MLTSTCTQVLPYTSLPDHEEEQPLDPHHAAGSPGHPPQDLREIRSVLLFVRGNLKGWFADTDTEFGKEKSESLEGMVWRNGIGDEMS
jgi:hypothetical protein